MWRNTVLERANKSAIQAYLKRTLGYAKRSHSLKVRGGHEGAQCISG